MPTNTQQVTIPIENATLNYIIQHETRRFIDNLDPSNPPTPTEIEIDLIQQIKAQIIYPKSFIQFNNERLIVKKAHASNHSEHALSVPTKDGDYLTIESLINKNGKLITANDYINSMFS